MKGDTWFTSLATNVIANAITPWLLGTSMASALAIWGKIQDAWSWPAAIIAGLVCLAAFLVIYSNIGPYKRKQKWDTWLSYHKRLVGDHVFQNEKVVLDGYSFRGCTFQNVTFEYNETAPFEMVHNKIVGTYLLSTKSPSVLMLLKFLKEFRYLRTEVQILESGQTLRMQPNPDTPGSSTRRE